MALVTMSRTRGGNLRRVLLIALAALLAFATLSLVPAAPGVPGAHRADAQVGAQVPAACQADVLFILDESGSMGRNNDQGEDAVRAGFTAFVNALAVSSPDSRIGVVDFATSASPQLGAAYVDVSPANDGNPNPTLISYINNAYSSGGWTNWEDAIGDANGYTTPDWTIMVTDGNPTTWNNTPSSGDLGFSPPSPQSDFEDGWETGTYAALDESAAHGASTFIGIGAGQDFPDARQPQQPSISDVVGQSTGSPRRGRR